ncbi:MAG: 4-hydroxy-2-oxovalerate aldolase, partial [Candidatus Hydrogenedentes bacterium]|nr:4-hydroxy-2-oxovalerate aldolase [Candidatus Hydrogenedentota bacterium]
MSGEPLEILDATLRDGSYVIDFQFTAEDTSLIASTLESAGVGLIEVGHGLGLGAAREGKGEQPASDEEYLTAAANALKSARFGAFFIPGIGTEDDLRLAADCGVHFVRIGCNVNALDEAAPLIEAAKKLGFTVFSNLMKSYAVPAEEFGACGKRAEDCGTDVLCLVDSAGGMLPEDVAEYLCAARAACGLRLDFHGHNNLSMAVANTVAAYDAGATILDTSLQGMGRSEGNAATEATVAILQKRGLLEHIDVNALLDASGAFVRPLLRNKGFSSLGITSGRAKFHSSFLGRVMEAAKAAAVDPRDLILRLCEFDQIEAPGELVNRVAAEVAETDPKPPVRFSIPPNRDGGRAPLLEQVRRRAAELKEKGHKLNIPSVLNVVVAAFEPTHVSPFVEMAFGCALSNVMLEDGESLADIFRAVDGVVDYILLDHPGAAGPAGGIGQATLAKTSLLTYSDSEMWARAVVNHVVQLLEG